MIVRCGGLGRVAVTNFSQPRASVTTCFLNGRHRHHDIGYYGYRLEDLLGGVAEGVVVHEVVATAHGHADAVLVAFEHVARDVGVERLKHSHAGIAVVVAVVV